MIWGASGPAVKSIKCVKNARCLSEITCRALPSLDQVFLITVKNRPSESGRLGWGDSSAELTSGAGAGRDAGLINEPGPQTPSH